VGCRNGVKRNTDSGKKLGTWSFDLLVKWKDIDLEDILESSFDQVRT